MFLLASTGIGPVVGVVPRECHVANAETVELAQCRQGILDGVTTFDSHQRRDLSLPLRATNIGGGGRDHQIPRMALDCSINRVDHVQSATRGSAMLDVPWFDVKRKELGGKSTLLHAFDAGAE